VSSVRAGAIAWAREHSLRSAVDGFQIRKERWGHLTLAQIRRMSRLLANHAGVNDGSPSEPARCPPARCDVID
jgi:hypothetical protein